MFERLVIFGIGYVLGAQAGRQALDDLGDTVRSFLNRDDVKTVLSLAGGLVEERMNTRSEGLRVA
ncbi:MAG: hypothetical protein ACREN2_09565 [Candidatus Dormibacteria bacterium]